MTWPDNAHDWAELFQSILTSTAIIIGAFWTYRIYRQKRQKYPRANLSLDIIHRPIGHNKVLLHITAQIANLGEVLLIVDRARTTVEQVLPLPNEVEQALVANRSPVRPGETDIVWPYLDYRERAWERGKFELEPGESDTVQYDFVIGDDVKTVLIHSYVWNAHKYRSRFVRWLLRQQRELGWGTSRVYDLSP